MDFLSRSFIILWPDGEIESKRANFPTIKKQTEKILILKPPNSRDDTSMGKLRPEIQLNLRGCRNINSGWYEDHSLHEINYQHSCKAQCSFHTAWPFLEKYYEM